MQHQKVLAYANKIAWATILVDHEQKFRSECMRLYELLTYRGQTRAAELFELLFEAIDDVQEELEAVIEEQMQ